MMILKKIALIMSLVVMGCAGAAKPAPIAPPTPVAIVPNPVLHDPPAPVLSETVKEYKGSTWSVSLPDNMVVDAQDDESIKVKATDGSMMLFVRQDSKDSLEEATGSLVAAFALKGHQPAKMFQATVGQWPAAIVLYSGGRGVVAVALFTTGTHLYACMYMGADGHDRVVAYKAALDSIVVSDKAVEIKKDTKAVKPAKK